MIIDESNNLPEAAELKNSSVVGLITNFKRKRMFEENQNGRGAREEGFMYLRVADHDFYIDLDDNDILTDLFSAREIAGIVADLIVDTLRLETNVRIVSRMLDKDESDILELSAKGYDDQQLSAKTGKSTSEIAVTKDKISKKLKKDSFHQAMEHLKLKKLQ